MSRSAVLALALALAPAALPAPARAGNAVRPRTPVIHLGEACLVTLDRAATPTVALTYTIPYEDACPRPHGAPTHQFFRLCRAPLPGESPPQWLSEGDLWRAVLTGVVLPPTGPADITPHNPDWSSCLAPISDPRPITCEAAREDVVWDLRDMSPGTYAVAAYTFHPPVNLWTPRWGLFRVIDGADAPPAAALANREAFLYADEILDLDVCAAGEPGSVLDLAYARAAAPDDWRPIAAAVPLAGERTHVPWDPPPELGGEVLHLRVEIRDPQGRRAAAVAPEPIHVLAVPGQSADPPAPDPEPDLCRPPDQDLPALECSEGQAPEDMPSEPGCGCSTSARAPHLLALALLALARRRQRGSSPVARPRARSSASAAAPSAPRSRE